MSRTALDAPTLAALAAAHVTSLLLFEFGFDSGTQYVTSAPHNVEWGGHTYLAAQGIGGVEPITETDSEVRGLVFTLSAVAQSAIAGALTEAVQGRPVLVRMGVVDSGTLRVDPNVWSGFFDVMTIEDNPDGPMIRATCEHAMIAWQQAKGTLFSDQDQRAIDDSDLFFEYAAQMAEATIVWPNKSFFK